MELVRRFFQHRSGKIFVAGLSLVILASLGYAAYRYQKSGLEEHGVAVGEKPGYRAVHWHAELAMQACGEQILLPLNRGTPLLHTHKEPGRIHIEGLVSEDDPATLGDFMDAVGIPFAAHRLFAYENGDGCSDAGEDRLHIEVQGVEESRFRDLFLQDGQEIFLWYD